MSIVSEAVADVHNAQVLAAGLCPLMALVMDKPRITADATAFCAHCPDAERIPRECKQNCQMYHTTELVDSVVVCRYVAAMPRWRCTCFMPKGVAWNNAYSTWTARRERDMERQRRIERGRLDYGEFAEMIGKQAVG